MRKSRFSLSLTYDRGAQHVRTLDNRYDDARSIDLEAEIEQSDNIVNELWRQNPHPQLSRPQTIQKAQLELLPPLRLEHYTQTQIGTDFQLGEVLQMLSALAAHAYLVMADGELVSVASAIDPFDDIRSQLWVASSEKESDPSSEQWRVVGWGLNIDEDGLECAHSSRRIMPLIPFSAA